MSTDPTEVARVAAELTEAQKAVLQHEDAEDGDFFSWDNEEGLVHVALVEFEENRDGYWMWLTSLGLAVRAHLLKINGAKQ